MNKKTIQPTSQEASGLTDHNGNANISMKPNILLDFKIKRLRKKLVETGIKKGLNHQETLMYSQRLDKLILKSLF